MSKITNKIIIVMLIQCLVFLTIGYTVLPFIYTGNVLGIMAMLGIILVGVTNLVIIKTVAITKDTTGWRLLFYTPLMLAPTGNIIVSFVILYKVLQLLFKENYDDPSVTYKPPNDNLSDIIKELEENEKDVEASITEPKPESKLVSKFSKKKMKKRKVLNIKDLVLPEDLADRMGLTTKALRLTG